MTQLAFASISLAQAPNSNALALFLDGADGVMKVKDIRGVVAPLSDFVTGGGGGGGLSGNLIDVSSNVVNFVGGNNTYGDIIVVNSSGNNFSFQSSDNANSGLTILGNQVNDNATLALYGNIKSGGGVAFIDIGVSNSLNFFSSNLGTPSTFARFEPRPSGSYYQFDFYNYGRILAGSDESPIYGTINGVSYASDGVAQIVAIGFDTDARISFVPNNGSEGFASFIDYQAGQLHFSFNGTNVANFTGTSTADFILYNNMTIGNTTSPVSSSLEVFQTGNSNANVRLSGKTTGDNAYLRFVPFAGSSSFIDFVSGQLHFSFNGTELARFGANDTGAFIQYFNMCVGYGTGGTSPSGASLEVYRTTGQDANIKLSGKTTGDFATLLFNPFAGSQSFLNSSAQLNFQFGGSTIANYTSTTWTFSASRVSITPALTTNLSALTLTPTYSSTGNNALSITGSSSLATTRGISITSSYTGATSNAFYIGSSVTASGGLAVSGLIAPTLVASAIADVLVAKDINPTFQNGGFTGVFNHSLRVQTGSVAFATTSGFVTIGDTFSRSITTAKFSVTQVSGALGFTSAIQVDVRDANYGLYINNPVGAGLSGLPKYGVYANVAHGNQDATRIPYAIYGKSSNGYGGYGGYFEYGNSNSPLQASSYYGIYATITGFNSAGSTNSMVYSGYFSMINNINTGGTGMTYGIAINQVAQSGTKQWKYFECQFNGTSEFYIGSQTTISNGRQIWSSIGMLLTTTATTDINASAMLQIDSTTKGFLPPRMTGAQAVGISSPSTGLMVYATSSSGAITTAGWWGYNGTTWVQLG